MAHFTEFAGAPNIFPVNGQGKSRGVFFRSKVVRPRCTFLESGTLDTRDRRSFFT
jgi:hypothetical protein